MANLKYFRVGRAKGRLALVLLPLCASLGSVVAGDTRDARRRCTSRMCEEAGDALVRSLDETIDPCDNFHRHACGGWIAADSPGNSESGPRRESPLSSKVLGQLRESLEERTPTDTGAARKAKDFYRSCVDQGSGGSIAPVVSMVEANGGWPLAVPPSRWALGAGKSGLAEILENYARRGAYWPLLLIQPRARGGASGDRRRSVLTVRGSTPPFKIWQAFDIKAGDRNVTTYESYFKEAVRKFVESGGFGVSSSDTDRDVDDAIAFEKDLWKATALSTGARNVSTTIAELRTKWNSAVAGRPDLAIDWLRVIRGSLDRTGVEIDEDETISLHPRDNVAAIGGLLRKTPVRTIVNYIHWYVVYDALGFTNANERFIDDTHERPADRCIHQPELNHAYSYVYARKYFGNVSLATAAHAVSRIQSELERRLDRATWLSDTDKLRIATSIRGLRKQIGYPSWYDEPGKVDEYYGELSIGPQLHENMLAIRRFSAIVSGKTLRKSNAEYAESAYSSYGQYFRLDTDNNVLVLPAGSLQSPLFRPENPRSMYYGAAGLTVANNIVFALLYDGAVGSEDRAPSFSASTIARYNDRTKCFVDQYARFPLTKKDGRTIYVDGRRDLPNHLSDNAGIRLAYDSYKREGDVGKVGIEAPSRFSDEQLFFYSIANQFCAIYPAGRDSERASAHRIRVNGALSNFHEFSEAFNCSGQAPMNPENKCALFD